MSDILISAADANPGAARADAFSPRWSSISTSGGKSRSWRMEAAMNEEQTIFLVTQKDVLVDDPEQKDLYEVGTVAHIKQVLRLPGMIRSGFWSMACTGLKSAPWSRTAPISRRRVETLNIPSYRKQHTEDRGAAAAERPLF